MFETMTFENILNNLMNRISDKFDKREGSMMYNSLAPTAVEIAEAYIALDFVNDEGFVDTATYNGIVKKCRERAIYPIPATKAIVKGEFNIDVAIGSRFSLDDLNYVVKEKISTGVFKLECEETGPVFELGNLIPIDYIHGLESAKLTEILVNGENDEDEESLKQRFDDSLDGQAFGGNIPDYKQKVNKLQDVGGVKVYPVWKGGGTVKLVIIDSNYRVPNDELVNNVQEAIDPIDHHGEGLGLAPIGHSVTVIGVSQSILNIRSNITYQQGLNFIALKDSINKVIDDYFLELNKTWDGIDNIIVRISQIETRLLAIDGIIDIDSTLINEVAANFIADKDAIVVRGEIVG